MPDKDDLAALVKNAYYHARDNGGTMHTAADDAADAILAAGWVHFSRQAQLVRAERDALAAVIERVRALHSQDTSLLAPGKWCPACGDETPCPTMRALAAERSP